MANRRLVKAISENVDQGSSASLVVKNNGLRSKQFQMAAGCSSKQNDGKFVYFDLFFSFGLFA